MQVIDRLIGWYYGSFENVLDEWIDPKLKLSDWDIKLECLLGQH